MVTIGNGDAITNIQKSENFERPLTPDSVSPIDKFDTHLQLNVLYKKTSWAIKATIMDFILISEYNNVKNYNMNRCFCILTVSTPDLVYSLGGLRYTFLLQMSKIGGKMWPPFINKTCNGRGLTGNWL